MSMFLIPVKRQKGVSLSTCQHFVVGFIATSDTTVDSPFDPVPCEPFIEYIPVQMSDMVTLDPDKVDCIYAVHEWKWMQQYKRLFL